MKELAFIRPAPVFIEIRLNSLKAVRGEAGLEALLERQSNGRLTGACRERVSASLKGFLKRKSWLPPVRAFCAIGASGVSLRRLTLPAAAREDAQKLLLLQIETEFPLAPEELAWGWRRLETPSADAVPARQEFLVAAVRKEVLEDYAGLLRDCGLSPVFTVAGLARNWLCPRPGGSCAMLDLDRRHSEWIVFEDGAPAHLRIFPWGAEQFAPDGALELLARTVRANWKGRTIYLTGGTERDRDLAASRFLGDDIECRSIPVPPGDGQTAAILGLKKCAAENGQTLPLTLQIKPKPVEGRIEWSEPALRKWAVTAVALLLALAALPYGEALLFRPFLARRLAAIQSGQGRLDAIDREMNFLQFLKENQPPYLDALYLFAQAAPAGARFDSLSMNRHGEVSLRGSMRNSQQVVEFRSKLIKSGFFSDVSVEEQVPTPDRQKVNVRMTAQWKPLAVRELLSIGPSAAEIKRVAARRKEPTGGAFPAPGAMPAMLPANFAPPIKQ